MAEHGTFYWNELMTRDAKAACAFYGQTLGWTFDTMPMPDGTYYMAKTGDKMAGGIYEMKGPQFDGVPTVWFAYIAVDDVDKRVAGAVKAGAKIVRPAWDVPGVGRIAIITDPTGASIGWMTPASR